MKLTFKVTLRFSSAGEGEEAASEQDYQHALSEAILRQMKALYGRHYLYVFGPDPVPVTIEGSVIECLPKGEEQP